MGRPTCLVLAVIAAFAASLAGAQEWAHSYGPGSGLDVAPTPDRGLVVAGSTTAGDAPGLASATTTPTRSS